jgi:AcrR family transcriptional regulator
MSVEKEQETEVTTGGKGKRRKNSRRKILDAARELFVERGYHDTRPQDISKAAGVGHGTFYLHFADKRECFAAFVEEAQSSLQAEVDKWTAEATNMDEHLRGVLKGVLTFSAEHPGVITAAITDPGVIGQGDTDCTPKPKSLIEVWATEWAEGLSIDRDHGRIHGDYDIPAISFSILGFVLFACRYALDNETDTNELVDNTARFLLRALKVDE